MRTLALALFAVGVTLVASVGAMVAAAPVPKHLMKAPPSDLDGKWQFESMRRGAKPFDVPPGAQTLEFRKDVLITVYHSGAENQVISTAVLTHDPTKKRFSATRHQDINGRIVNPDVTYGYAIDGDKLILATSQGPNLAFGAADPLKPGENDVVVVLTRVKK
ncbi:MAG: hypothetical protein L0241_18570 [Planctomycetia bacterium]|nr:hypothetical protein [Planctomycetia bacterium]